MGRALQLGLIAGGIHIGMRIRIGCSWTGTSGPIPGDRRGRALVQRTRRRRGQIVESGCSPALAILTPAAARQHHEGKAHSEAA